MLPELNLVLKYKNINTKRKNRRKNQNLLYI